MAWESFEEEALHIIGLHTSVMTREQKETLNRLYFQHIFPERKDTWSMEPGSAKYCIINSSQVPNFEKKLLLLTNYLPHEKMCFYPPKKNLVGPFLRTPWKEIGKSICGHTLGSCPPLLRTIIYTQQFAVFLKTRVDQQLPWIEEP